MAAKPIERFVKRYERLLPVPGCQACARQHWWTDLLVRQLQRFGLEHFGPLACTQCDWHVHHGR